MLATHAQFLHPRPRVARLSFRPIRTDSTPVDWAVLIWKWRGGAARNRNAYRVHSADDATTGLSGDLWRRICDAFFPHAADAELTANDFNRVTGLTRRIYMRASGAWS